jgi:SAM-dependent methyltransferase
MNASNDEAYFAYLRRRSLTGFLYRKLWLYPFLKRHLPGRVLDVGCGIGDFLKSCPRAIGTDINPLTVQWCRGHGLNVTLMEADRLPFDDASFDGVVLDNVLEHLSEPKPLLTEIRRVLRPGGVCVVGVPGPRGYAADDDHKKYYDEPLLRQVLAEARFASVKMVYQPFRNDALARRLPQFALYGVFRRRTP